MTMFTYQVPMYKGSIKSIDILDENRIIVGSIQRKYRGFSQKIIDIIMSSDFVINVNTFDDNNELRCEISEDMGWKSWVKSSWIGKSNILGDFTLVDQTKIRTHPRLELQTAQGEKFYIKKDFADKRVFIENEAGVTTAEISYDKIIPPQTITIQLKSPEMHFLEVAALYYLLNIRY